MIENPMLLQPAFEIGGLVITKPVVTTWAILAVLGLGSWAITRRLSLSPGRVQAVAELLVQVLDDQIRATTERDPAPLRALIGTLFLFILCANWSSLIPGVEPPTAQIETDAALAALVFAATIGFGIAGQGLGGYLKSFAQPSWVMIPLNLVEQVTRTLSLTVRLFGNVMSGTFIIAIVLSLAGLLVPIPLMALDLLTGAVQAYIFATLAIVFIGAAIAGEGEPAPTQESKA